MNMRSFICHRKPERTFKIGERYFPVCSRCTGIYLGAFSYFILVHWFFVKYDWVNIIFAILMVVPTFMDGLTQLLLPRESFNSLRFPQEYLQELGGEFW